MKTTMFLIVALLLAVMGSTVALAATVTLNPTGDATLSHYGWNTGNENSGAATTLADTWVDGYGGGCDSMMKWDVSAVPTGATVTKATFGWFYNYPETDGGGDTGRQCWFYQADTAWDEMTVTWNNAPAKGAYVFYNSVYPGYGGWRTTVSDLTNVDTDDDELATWVASALANPTLATNGWRISGPSGGNTGVTMFSREQADSMPYLTLEYTVVPEPSSLLVLAAGILPLVIRRKRS